MNPSLALQERMETFDRLWRDQEYRASRLWPVERHDYEQGSGDEILPSQPIEQHARRSEASAWIYACRQAHASAISTLELQLFRAVEGEDEQIEEHPFLDLWNNPNEYQSASDLQEGIVQHLLDTGNAFVSKEGVDLGVGEPTELYLLRPAQMSIIGADDKRVGAYVWRSKAGVKETFAPDEVCHILLTNPASPYWGLSPMTAASLPALLSAGFDLHNYWTLVNGGKLGVALKAKGHLSDDAKKAAMRDLRKLTQPYNRRGREIVIDDDAEIIELGKSPRDLDWIEGKKVHREEILAVYGCVPLEVGILEFANWANAQQQMRKFWDKARRWAMKIEQAVTRRIVKQHYGQDLYVRFDFGSVEALQEDKNQEAERLTKLVESGMLTPDQALKLQGLPPTGTDHGQTYYLPLNLVPVAREDGSLVEGVGDESDRQTEAPSSDRAGSQRRHVTGTLYRGARREIRRRVFLAQIRPREDTYARMVRGFYEGQRRRVQENLSSLRRGLDIDFVLFDLEDETHRAGALAAPLVTRFVEEGAREVLAELHVNVGFSVQNPAVKARVSNLTGRFADQVVRRTERDLRRILVAGVDEGASIDDLARRIDAFYDLQKSNARRIARTEVVGASNAGSLEGMRSAGDAVEGKEWLSAQDGDVRSDLYDHSQDGEIVRLEQPFLGTGEALDHPGDPSGSAGNVINCRCSVLPVVRIE